MMRVGIDASNLRAGGGVTHLTEMLAAGDPPSAGIESVVVWAGRDTLARLPRRPWLTPEHEPALDGRLPARLHWQRYTLQRRAAAACDLLFAPGGGQAGAFRPYVTMSRNLLPFQPEERRRYGASWMFVKLELLRHSQTAAFRRADGVIFLNEFARGCVTAVAGPLPGRIAVIPHGVDDRFRLPPRPQRPLAHCSAAAPFRLLYVSTVEPYKHQWHVVDAVHRLRAQGLPLELTLAGGPAGGRARLDAAIATHDPDGRFVRDLGAVDHARLAAIYQAADAFVFASSCENMPNILLEAMAAGLPIACAERGPMPAMLGDGGTYFDPLDPADIAAAIDRLVRDAERRATLAARAFERAADYSWTRCAQETLAFLAAVRGGFGGH
jgi:glycosyltransferase involved in cell wall biosynthesis